MGCDEGQMFDFLSKKKNWKKNIIAYTLCIVYEEELYTLPLTTIKLCERE